MALKPLFLNPRGGPNDGDVGVIDRSPFGIGRRPESDLELAQVTSPDAMPNSVMKTESGS